ncbi:sorbosone dehydrogenase family protein [Brachybacterium sp. FME24]|uniref:PQQ-dependent sugar dehydrogenase n=1 Tax=Brachybacterium sp. FME24 TaxID=2742605 RepID=UPI0027145903|nr:PQQ-dependent sugar dehydrogenase [Brachybacterium sp. FME24]
MITRRRFTALSGVLAAGGLLASCSDSPDGPGPDDVAGSESSGPDGAEILTIGLDAPWSITFHGETALVSERDSARILELAPDGTAREVGVIDGVVAGGEGGLLGIVAHDGDLFTYFTAADGNRIERRPLTGSPGAISLGDPSILLDAIPSAGVHNGGRLAVGPDEMLYATVGDATDRDSAQDTGALSGKILRMTPDGDVPEDNPLPDSLVYSYGHRNPQGIAWGQDGTMYASEFGQDTWDELNVIEPGGNYGWPEVEGIADQEEYLDPVQQWSPAEASPSGIAIAGGRLYVANLRGARLWVAPLEDLSSSTQLLVGEVGRLRDVVTAPDGSLWVLTNNTDGRGNPADADDRILRFDPAP